jgi:hypothetical protein
MLEMQQGCNFISLSPNSPIPITKHMRNQDVLVDLLVDHCIQYRLSENLSLVKVHESREITLAARSVICTVSVYKLLIKR